jgi:phosphoglucomutase
VNYQESYELWKNFSDLDKNLKAQLNEMTDPAEIEDAFYEDLQFGTGGMRGRIGVGTNRMNRYMVAKATKGLGQFLIGLNEANQEKGVVISHDPRNMSPEFATFAARVLAAMGMKVYLFEDLRPTPELSFAVRYLKAAGGIMITASHNPKEYNGYKVYGSDGGQMVDTLAEGLVKEIASIQDYLNIPMADYDESVDKGLITIIGEEIDAPFTEAVKEIVKPNPGVDLKVIYTPIHGTGNIPVRRVLKELGYACTVVPEQEKPDGNFPTVAYPNPEEKAVFNIAMKMAEEQDTDIIIGTDPDCDRVGVVYKDDRGDFQTLTGNQIGALLVNYYLKTRTELPDNKVVIKTIVTSELGGVVAKANGAEVIDVLTGFKYIGEWMNKFEETGEKTFAFGYEESYGYLAGNYARDKDAVLASALICEMTAYYKQKGLTLYDALLELYEEHGYFIEGIQSFTMEGIEGRRRIEKIMDSFRSVYFKEFADAKLVTFKDYKISESTDMESGEKSKIDLPSSNVLKFIFNENSWYALRPSGTEPKLKIYYSVTGRSKDKAQEKMETLKAEVNKLMDAI